MRRDGSVECHEVKGGYVRETGKAKFKIAARLCPIFRWRLMQQTSASAPWEEIMSRP
jgi:hypothetical protein